MAGSIRARWPGIRVLVGSVVFLIAVWYWMTTPQTDSTWQLGAAAPVPEGTFHCVRVVDGDTLLVRPLHDANPTATFRVRLVGIDAPEDTTRKEPFGPQATAFLKSAVEGKSVELHWDKRRIDRYGRRLAYVYCDESFVNQELVLQGLARGFAYPGDNATFARDLQRAEQEARLEGRGIWSLPTEQASADVRGG